MLDLVRDAFDILREDEKEYGPNEQGIDGCKGFIFQSSHSRLITHKLLITNHSILTAFLLEDESF